MTNARADGPQHAGGDADTADTAADTGSGARLR